MATRDPSGDRRVLLVGGNRKSGTTLLHSLLNGHPEIFAPPHDLNIFYAYFPGWTGPDVDPDERRARLLRTTIVDWKDRYVAAGMEEAWEHLADSVTAGLDTIDLSDIGDVVDLIVECLWELAPDGARILAVKETSTEMYAPGLLRTRPSWRFLHLFRDPRDNYAALADGQSSYYSQLGNDDLDTISSLVLRVKFGHQWLTANRAEFGDRYELLRFEDLVSDPRVHLGRLADWLGVAWHDALLDPSWNGRSFEGNSHTGKRFDGITAEHLGSWRTRISPDSAQVIEFMLEHEMVDLGYLEPDGRPDPVAAGAWYAAMNFKYFFGDRFA